MKQYLLSIYQPDGGSPPPEVLDPVLRALATLNAELDAAGVTVFKDGLQPPETATVVRAKGDDILLTDGPYVEGKEHIGGFWIIKAPDLDAALEWAAKAARAVTLPIEVRPLYSEA
ncbi:YciI family protein [Catellatospora paridis]|uniref:YciI family protein n=1 Tax=Catellatospora paridis TaxID=1617086 RepID=UPI0012D3F774|nr:YciI family protein [Catellatospora paridis]